MTDAQSNTESYPGFWKIVSESLRGSHRNYTEGPIGVAILTLAIPMVLEMLMESVFAVADIFFVGKLGPDAVATVGLTESMLMIVYTVGIGLSIGATAMVARRIGEQDHKGAALAAGQALTLGAIVSVAIGVLGVVFAADLLKMMGASESVIESGVAYTRTMLGGNVVILMLFLANAIFRGAGDGAIAMRALWIANGANIVLAPCFIFGFGPIPAFGVTGAAIGTTVGRGIGASYTLYHLFTGKGRVKASSSDLKINPVILGRILRLSSSGMLQVFISTASWIGLVRVISSFGSNAVAGYTIGIRVVLFALFPSFGLSSAAATMVGQALGAKKPERASQAVWRTGFYSCCFLGFMGVIFLILAPQIVAQFTHDPEVATYAINCLRIVSSGFLFYAYGIVFVQSFNGAGDTWTPTLLNLFVFWLWEVPLAYVLAVHLDMGPVGVFWAITIAFSTLAFASAYLFKKGTWQTKRV